MGKFIINTTGTLDPVIFYDLGYRTFYTADTVNYDLTQEYTIEEISKSEDIKRCLESGYITAKDERDNIISSTNVIGKTIITLSNNRWVDVYGSDTYGVGDGTITNPFKTIQKAIDSITGSSINNVYTINLGIGVFSENLILKNGLSFVGLNKHIFDSSLNLTVISGNVIYNALYPTDFGFTNISFEGSGNTISLSGSNSANTCTVNFRDCKINTIFSATNNTTVVSDNVHFTNIENNVNISNNSIFKSVSTSLIRGINVDDTSVFSHCSLFDFNRDLSNIVGTEIRRTDASNLGYDNTISGLSAVTSQGAIDELFGMISLSGGGGGSLTPIHHIENTASNVTYTGFGTTGATSIMKVISYSANTYDVLWAEGNKIKDKIWTNRFTYTYSAIT